MMELCRQDAGAQGQKGHGQDGQQGQRDMNIAHEAHGRDTHERGVHGGNQAHTAGHLDRRQVIADMSHYVARGVLLEKQRIHLQHMGEDPIPDDLLHDPRKTEDHQAPDKTQAIDADGDQDNDPGKLQQRAVRGGAGCQPIHPPFQDPGNEKLQQVNGEKREAADQDTEPVLPENGSKKAQQPAQTGFRRLLPLSRLGIGMYH